MVIERAVAVVVVAREVAVAIVVVVMEVVVAVVMTTRMHDVHLRVRRAYTPTCAPVRIRTITRTQLW